LSGDRSAATQSVATETTIARWQAAASPPQKVAYLEAMQHQGLHPLMVGDGLNDAAALASAYVSMSPGTAIDAAQAQADIVLRSPDLMPIAYAIKIARVARRL